MHPAQSVNKPEDLQLRRVIANQPVGTTGGES
jgi:hypothetical protein